MKGEKKETQPTTGEVRCLKAERQGERAWLPSSSHLPVLLPPVFLLAETTQKPEEKGIWEM